MSSVTVSLFSEANCLAVCLVESLLVNHCRVKIFARDIKNWFGLTEHIQTKEFIAYYKTEDIKNTEATDYSLFINTEKDADVVYIENAVDYSLKNKTKTFIVLSFRSYKEAYRKINLPDTVGLIFVGDMIGPRMDLSDVNPIAKIFISEFNGKKFTLSEDETIYPVFIGDVSRLITRWLFSFGPFGSTTAILSEGLSAIEMIEKIKKNKSEGSVRFPKERAKIPEAIKRINLKFDLDGVIAATVEWFHKGGRVNVIGPERESSVGNKVYKPTIKGGIPVLITIAFFLIFPILLLLASLLSMYQAKRFLEKGNLGTARQLLGVSNKISHLAEGQFILYSHFPIFGGAYRQPLYVTRAFNTISSIGIEGIDLLKDGSYLVNNVFKGIDYDVYYYSEKLAVRFDTIYKNAAFLEGELRYANGYWERLLSTTAGSYGLNDTGQIKNMLMSGKIFMESLPDVLGANGKKTYLVLLQNNMELRPTGGFIGSFALVTLDGGKISDITIQDVYSADGQLKGYVKPPDPIKNYLGEANWFLRDSNWDPDFPTSAQRAEWFLDKEIDVRVDGVISIDLEPVKDLMKVYGPIFLKDFDVTLDESNFYEKTQVEAEKDFFPGSYRKSGFLTAIARALTDRFSDSDEQGTLDVAKIFYENLNQKHIQIFLHNKNSQKVISDRGWDGAVEYQSCDGNCFSDWFGLVEANLGVNKSNYYIKRNYSLNATLLSGSEVNKFLITTYSNTANSALGPSAVYKTYTRLLVSPEAEIKNVYLVDGESKEELEYSTEKVRGRKEIGFFLEIPPGSARSLYIEWVDRTNLILDSSGRYQLLWRKQSGVGDEPVWVNYDFSKAKNYRIEADRSLTSDGKGGYNALLSRDIVSRIFW